MVFVQSRLASITRGNRANNFKLAALALVGVASLAAHADGVKFIKDWSDVQLYLKPKNNLVRTWDQEFGIQACVAKYGNLREQLNACYDPTYPIHFHSKPIFSIGEQTNYVLAPIKQQPAIYTKFKANFLGVWKEETGFTAKLYGSRSVNVSANLSYQYQIPLKSTAKPQWLALLNVNFPLH
ncbi:MAG TPA: hypothetical protein VKT78_08740 [Fimbriimonadaceae bacterium]|nr:hypothetical protein [Fimbriimonadaceae bacterium]